MRKLNWTEAEMAAKIGANTCALLFGKYEEPFGARHIAKYRELGITKMELKRPHYNPYDSNQLKEIAREAKNQGVDIVSLHGTGGKFSSAYDDGTTERERRLAVATAILDGEAALTLGASILVCHFGTTDLSEKSAHELIDYFDGTPLRFGAENVGKAVSRLKDSDFLDDHAAFVDRIDSDRLGMVLDTGHARDPDGINPFTKEGAAYDAIHRCRRRIIHLHLHDAGEGADDHLAPWEGRIRWFDILIALQDIGYDGVLMFESIISEQDQDVLNKIAAFPREFVRRYLLE